MIALYDLYERFVSAGLTFFTQSEQVRLMNGSRRNPLLSVLGLGWRIDVPHELYIFRTLTHETMCQSNPMPPRRSPIRPSSATDRETNTGDKMTGQHVV